ncbi:hypothetical protein RG959_15940 [Domibacillus sp. 8LH]
MHANSTSLEKMTCDADEINDPNKDYEAISGVYKFKDTDIIAVEFPIT